jgi:putative heme iron utilization protein
MQADTIKMIGIDSLGFDLRTNSEMLFRINFDQHITNAQEARTALVAMAKACK